jgi:hypothetical protein
MAIGTGPCGQGEGRVHQRDESLGGAQLFHSQTDAKVGARGVSSRAATTSSSQGLSVAGRRGLQCRGSHQEKFNGALVDALSNASLLGLVVVVARACIG